MDKHQLRRLRDNDRRMGKLHEEAAAVFRPKDKHLRDKRFIYEILRIYTPCSGRFLSTLRMPRILGDVRIVSVNGEQISVWLGSYPFRMPGRVFGHFWTEEPLLYRLNYDIELGNTHWFKRQRLAEYVWDPTEAHILVEDSLKKFQLELDLEYIRNHAPSFFRTTERNDLIRAELDVASRKRRAIENCKTIKEELMAAAWHPRRIERLLETHGWEAYENLLGE